MVVYPSPRRSSSLDSGARRVELTAGRPVCFVFFLGFGFPSLCHAILLSLSFFLVPPFLSRSETILVYEE
ncbi:hypothetical protein ACFX2G_005083 [Malus domestica]